VILLPVPIIVFVIHLDAIAIRQGGFRLGPVSLTVPAGRYAALMGPTGCGKTSLLEVVAGLRTPESGRVLLRGENVTRATPAARGIGYVPQDAAVFRTLTVRENLAFALRVRNWDEAAISSRVMELADWLGLASILDRRAVGLSGGEAHRVALGRALAFRPDVLLLDEPLSSLDEPTRDGLIELLLQVKATRATAVLHVTHSPTEAARLADDTVRLG
jgi:molybdate/tungstate transport system ATP-binding protein